MTPNGAIGDFYSRPIQVLRARSPVAEVRSPKNHFDKLCLVERSAKVEKCENFSGNLFQVQNGIFQNEDSAEIVYYLNPPHYSAFLTKFSKN